MRTKQVSIPKNYIKIIMAAISIAVLTAGSAFAARESVSAEDLFLKPFTLQELLSQVLERNQDVRAAKLKWQSAKKRQAQQLSLPDPQMGMDLMGSMTETRVGPQENRLMVGQKIPFPAKIWKKWQVEREKSHQARLDYEAVRRDVLFDTRKSYYQLYETAAALEVIGGIHEVLNKVGAVARSRYADGSAEQRDASKAQAEAALTLGRQYTLEQRRGALEARLNALLDRDPLLTYGRPMAPLRPVLEKTQTEFLTEAAKSRQEIQKGSHRVLEKQYKKTLAWMQNIPDLDAGFTYTWVGGGMTAQSEDGQDSWMFPLSINVPLWQNRNVAGIQEASLNFEAAEAEFEQIQNDALYEVRAAYLRCETAFKIVELYESSVLPQSELAFNADRAGYEAGRTDFLELLDSERVYLDAKLGYLKIYRELLISRATLDRVSGSEGNV